MPARGAEDPDDKIRILQSDGARATALNRQRAYSARIRAARSTRVDVLDQATFAGPPVQPAGMRR